MLTLVQKRREVKVKILLLMMLFVWTLSAKNITPSDVYAQVMLIKQEVYGLLRHYHVKYNPKKIKKESQIVAKLKPRDVWQKTYEIAVKINILRQTHNLPLIEPVNMAPVLHLNPDLVYEQTQRILTELKIFETRENITIHHSKVQKFQGKIPLDVFNGLTQVSIALDTLNGGKFTPSYVFGEQMRVYDDITRILNQLNIEDHTIPDKKDPNDKPKDVYEKSLKVLEKIKQLQIGVGIGFVDFSTFEKKNSAITPNEVYTLTEMIIAELQPIKAYLGVNSITPPASSYKTKTPAEVNQLVGWNLRKLKLIRSLAKD